MYNNICAFVVTVIVLAVSVKYNNIFQKDTFSFIDYINYHENIIRQKIPESEPVFVPMPEEIKEEN
jgi:hypothetical protein